ncbi:MAG: GNAT family N-acetyltransferase [Streptosporangiaceae bacterium]
MRPAQIGFCAGRARGGTAAGFRLRWLTGATGSGDQGWGLAAGACARAAVPAGNGVAGEPGGQVVSGGVESGGPEPAATGEDCPAAAVRAAVPGDAAEVIRLAALMYESMGLDASGGGWRQAARAELAARLGGDAAVFVADDPAGGGRLAAAGAGSIARRLPGPANPGGRAGYIQWVSTDPRWQRRGLARQITTALLGWFDARQVPAVELHATSQAEALYRSLGFGPGPNPGLRIRL